MKQTDGNWSLAKSPAFFQVSAKPCPTTKHKLVAVNELANADGLLELCDKSSILLDSGIFNLAKTFADKHGISHDEALRTPINEIDGFNELKAKWSAIVTAARSKLWGYIELDIGGREQKIKTRAGLEAEGFKPIPVIHPLNDGWDYFDAMADEYDRLCIGNIVQADKPTRRNILMNVSLRRMGKKVKWIHTLGISPTTPEWLAFPTESCDASSFESWMIFGLNLVDAAGFVSVDTPVQYQKNAHIIGSYCAAVLDGAIRTHFNGTVNMDGKNPFDLEGGKRA